MAAAAAVLAIAGAAGAAEPAPSLEFSALFGDLGPVADRLREVSTGVRERVTIVHLGDSHVQGELMTGPLRRSLQARFGAAGRGLVLPCEIAGTNGPADVQMVSDAEWNLSRLPAPDAGVPIGAAGMTVWTGDGGFILKVGLRGGDPGLAFDRITIFAEGGPGWTTVSAATHPNPFVLESSRPVTRDITYTIRKGDTLYGLGRKWGCTVEQIRKWNRLPSTLIRAGHRLIVRRVTGRRAPVDRSGFIPVARFVPADVPGPYQSTADLPVPVHHVFLRGSGTSTGAARLYGVLLDRRSARGIAYHSVGVNGAEFRDFNGAALLWHQIACLKPDLLIVTLGTNDALEAGFTPAAFEAHVEAFLELAGSRLDRVPVLLMGPPDLRTQLGRRLPAAATVREILDRVARRHEAVAYWSAADAMGGEGAILNWRKQRWAGPDFVHLTPEGYRRLADRLLDALFPPAVSRPESAGAGDGPG